MSIQTGVPLKITNIQTGLALHLADDNQSIVGNNIVDTDRQVVRIACSVNGFCWFTHNVLVDPRYHI